MASYLIKRNDDEQTITLFKCDKKGYDFKPNFTYEDINVKKITIYNPKMINNILTTKIDKSFRKLTAITVDILQSDDDSTAADGVMALNEVAKLRGIILNKYQKFLDKDIEEKYLKRLRILENELRSKIMYYKQMEDMYNNYINNMIAMKEAIDDERRNGR